MKSLLQTKEWADFRVSQGWQAHNIDDIYILQRKLPFGKSFLYAPEVNFEEIDSERSRRMEEFLQKLQKIAENSQAIFCRLEILDAFDAKIIENIKKFGFIKAFEELQPEYRQIIDISKPEEEILAQMKEKGRYNIRIAERNGVRVRESKNIDEFYEIFTETAKRDDFSIRPRKYFEKMLEILGANIELIYASFQGKIIAAEIVSYYDETASYLYGASSSEYRNVMAPYLLHWEAIKRAKEKGCKFYDLLAVSPEGDENHKFSGIGRFKRQFGGRTVHIVGGYDLVYKPGWYKLFKFAERYRRK